MQITMLLQKIRVESSSTPDIVIGSTSIHSCNDKGLICNICKSDRRGKSEFSADPHFSY